MKEASNKTKQGENKFNVWQQQQPSSSSSLNLLSSWSEILRDRPPPVAGFGMLQIVFFHFLYRAHPSIDRKGSTTTKTTTTTYLHNFFLLWSFREIEFVDISEHKSHLIQSHVTIDIQKKQPLGQWLWLSWQSVRFRFQRSVVRTSHWQKFILNINCQLY